MMKKILLLSVLICFQIIAFGQGEKRLKFNACFKETKPGEGEIVITSKIEKNFHIFAFDPGGDGSQTPTEVKFEKSSDITLVGGVTESGKKITEEIKELDIKINYFKDEVKYIQKVTYKKKGKTTATVTFQVCNDEMCERPADVKIPIDLNTNCDGSKATVALVDTPTKSTIASVTKNDTQAVVASNGNATNVDTTTNRTEAANDGTPEERSFGMFGKIVSNCGEVQEEKLNPWLAFFYGILGGFAALFFPCTLPMIPMTISFFLKGDADKRKGVRNGVLYGFFIFLVYFLLSLPFLFLNLGGQALNEFATNPWINIVLFIIFIIFAFSLFGYYDISLPNSMANKLDAKSNNKSWIGIFFMALTLAIVSFSCTGPILGLVLGNVKSTGLITPAMSGFGIGLGVPFALFAIFPNLIKALPKSGGWLTTLKVVFGFIELAFALKFLSNADLVLQWGILKRELFIGIWIVICILTGLYLLGIFKLKKDSYYQKSTVTSILAVLCFVFAGYLSMDFFKKDISLVSGFPPPPFYSYFHKEEKLKNGTEAKTHNLKGLTVYLSLEDAMEEAKKQGKPVMIDFTGWACVNCRKMEENVWTQSEIYNTLKEKYIIASLYVDDKRPLPENEQFDSPALKKKAVSVGDKWFDLSSRHFQNAGQPYYALIDPVHNRILNTPVPYTPEAKKYKNFLDCGLTNYKILNP
jgi:thiol:disulfide interchange protein